MAINVYLIYLGITLLSFGMEKHYKHIFIKELSLSLKRVLKVLGGVVLSISFISLLILEGVSLGLTYWVAFLTPIVVLIALILEYKPKIVVKLSIVLFILSLVLNFI